MKEYSSCLAARGLIFNSRSAGKSSSSSGSGRGWRPLHKPQLFEVNKKVNYFRIKVEVQIASLCELTGK